ncbi:hypothetical protein B4Q13_22050, partial [Lacticaseibacillus rhamnosus]
DKVSSYSKVRFKTRQHYDAMLARIDKAYGDTPLSDIKARTIHEWHAEWAKGGKIAMAHQLVVMLRMLVSFGLWLIIFVFAPALWPAEALFGRVVVGLVIMPACAGLLGLTFASSPKARSLSTLSCLTPR